MLLGNSLALEHYGARLLVVERERGQNKPTNTVS